MITPESTSFIDSLYFDRTSPIVFFDLEATDKDVATARITQISIIRINPQAGKNGNPPMIQRYASFFNPTVPITEEAAKITGLTNEMLAEYPLFKEEAPIILSLLQHAAIGGHNIIVFDIPLLAEELLRAGLDLPKNFQIIDTHRMFEKILPRTLESAYNFFTGAELQDGKYHDAEYDTLASLHVFSNQVNRYHHMIGNSPAEWDKISRRDKVMVDFAGKLKVGDDNIIRWAFGKLEGKPVNYDYSYAKWFMDQTFFTQDSKRWVRHGLDNNAVWKDPEPTIQHLGADPKARMIENDDLPI